MKVNEVIQDEWMMFQCTKCFNRFGVDRLLINSDGVIICPIDKHPVKQLLKKQGQDARIELKT